MKYNIALVPRYDKEKFISYAENLSSIAPPDRYHIGGESSIPHVSLCHFECEYTSIDNIWQEVQSIEVEDIRLTFNHRRSKTYPDSPKDAGVSWVSLIPDNLDFLKDLHLRIADIIKEPLNSAFENYDPHMTLFNSKNDEECEKFNYAPNLVEPLEDDFTVVIGTVDNVGQITQITHSNMSSSPSIRI